MSPGPKTASAFRPNGAWLGPCRLSIPTPATALIVARDARFDGIFFVGVKTTGIYCRPICPARTPGRDRCLFFRTAAEAEAAGFRSCFRCRPELAPGAAPVDALSRLVAAAMRRIEDGALSDGTTVEELAAALGVSARHLRRAMQAELGVGPLPLAESRRLALARQLIVDTALPMTEVAFASGFRSVRRFNAAVRARYGRPPSAMRRGGVARESRDGETPGETVTVRLPYRPPYDWPAILGLPRRARDPGRRAGARTASTCGPPPSARTRGWLSVAADPDPDPKRPALRATISTSLTGVLMSRRGAAAASLRSRRAPRGDRRASRRAIARLARHVRARPGLRVAGAFDPFEAAARAVLGQQVSVAAGGTIAARLTRRLGEAIATPHPALTRLFPDADAVAGATARDLAALGVPASRAATLRALARAVVAR